MSLKSQISSTFNQVINFLVKYSTPILIVIIVIMGILVFRGCGDTTVADTKALLQERDSIRSAYETKEKMYIATIAQMSDTVKSQRLVITRQSAELKDLRANLNKEKIYAGSLAQQVRQARKDRDTALTLAKCDELADQVDTLVAAVVKYELKVDTLTASYETQLALKDRVIDTHVAHIADLNKTVKQQDVVIDDLSDINKKQARKIRNRTVGNKVLAVVAAGLAATLLIVK